MRYPRHSNDPETGLRDAHGLLYDLAAVRGTRRTIDLISLARGAAIDEPFLLAEDPAVAQQIGGALRTIAGRRLGAAYRVAGSTYAIVAPAGDALDSAVAVTIAAELGQVAPRYACGVITARVVVPDEASPGRPALRLAFDRLKERAGWQLSSPARQARDVLLRLMTERHVASDVCRTQDVVGHAVAVGRSLSLGLDELEDVVRAAELQNVGLLTLPDTMLRKTTQLDDLEWKRVRSHPIAGEHILSAAPALASVGRLVRSCYERYDGTGYPDGLRGEAIPLGARIIAVCVAFAAMTSDRPYRRPRRPAEAMRELENCAGSQFDPRVVEAFRTAVLSLAAPLGAAA